MRISLTFKFFIILLLATGVVVITMFFLMLYSFDRGFLDYVNTGNMERFETLAADVENAYAKNGDWRFLRGNYGRWADFLRDSLPEESRPGRGPGSGKAGRPGERTGPPPPFRQGRENRPPHPIPPGMSQLFEHRTVLVDDEGRKVFGPPDHPPDMIIRTLRHDGESVGYLGLIPQRHLTENLHLRFVKEQKRAFGLIALLTACLAALLSLPLARQMVKRIKALAAATHRLTAGRYETRLPAESDDELGSLVHDFNTLAKTLEQNEQMRRQWVGDISHELRTPLAVLRGEIEALQDKVRAATPEAFSSLHSEVMRLQRLVDDFFQLSMSDIGALTYHKENLDLAFLLDETVESFRNGFSDKGISISVNWPPERRIEVFGDPGRLQQLFENLLGNSMRYTDPGGRLDIGFEMKDNMVTMLWQDSEPGVGPEEMKKLFDRLYRVESSRSRASGGAGLGLAICRNIVEAHEGSIEVEPSVLGGVLFRIRLPLAGERHG